MSNFLRPNFKYTMLVFGGVAIGYSAATTDVRYKILYAILGFTSLVFAYVIMRREVKNAERDTEPPKSVKDMVED